MSRKKYILTAIVLVLILAIGGVLAYFTDVQTKHNKFRTSKVDVVVEEPSWPGQPIPNPDYNPENPVPGVEPTIDPEVPVVPNQEIPKDPQVVNKGDTAVYAFVTVTIPVRNVKTNTETATPTQLFTLRHITNANTTPKTTAEGINDGWTLIAQEPETITSTTTSVKYVYAYGSATELTEIAKPTVNGNTTTYNRTPALFDTVKFVDVTETGYSDDSEIQGKSFEVEVKGYGIQVDGLSSKVPLTVWNNELNK